MRLAQNAAPMRRMRNRLLYRTIDKCQKLARYRDAAVFEIYGHPKAQKAYASGCAAVNKEPRYVVVLEIPPVNSPQTAVQAAIAAQIVNGTFRR
jgi:hypothetical protein